MHTFCKVTLFLLAFYHKLNIYPISPQNVYVRPEFLGRTFFIPKIAQKNRIQTFCGG
jgi:hypothetical protein